MKARLSVMFVAALIMVVAAFQAPAAFAQQLNPNELQDEILQDTLQDTNTLQDTLQGVQAGFDGFDSSGCQSWNGGVSCWPKERIKETRDTCIAGAVFTFGLTLLVEDCQRVLSYQDRVGNH